MICPTNNHFDTPCDVRSRHCEYTWRAIVANRMIAAIHPINSVVIGSRERSRKSADFWLAVPDARLFGGGDETGNCGGVGEGHDAGICQLSGDSDPVEKRFGRGDVANHLEVIERVRYEVECSGFAHEFPGARLRHDYRQRVKKDRGSPGE